MISHRAWYVGGACIGMQWGKERGLALGWVIEMWYGTPPPLHKVFLNCFTIFSVSTTQDVTVCGFAVNGAPDH